MCLVLRALCEFTSRLPRIALAAVLSVLKELIIVSVGTIGLFSLENIPFKTVNGFVGYV